MQQLLLHAVHGPSLLLQNWSHVYCIWNGKTVKSTLLLFQSPVVTTCLFQTAFFQYNSNGFFSVYVLTGSIAGSAKCRLFKLLRGWFWDFSPRRATRCTDGGEIWHGSVPNFTPTGATIRIQDPQNWNFYWDLTKMWNIIYIPHFGQISVKKFQFWRS